MAVVLAFKSRNLKKNTKNIVLSNINIDTQVQKCEMELLY